MAKQILVIDDDEGILDGFRAILESVGYEVVTSPDASYFTSGEIRKLPDLILLDVLLSGIDGRVLCKTIKQNPKTRAIPIIMMSASTDVEKSVQDMGLASGFLKKPFEMDEVLNIVAQKLSRNT